MEGAVRELPSIHRPGVLEAVRASTGLRPEELRVLRNALYKRGLAAEEALALLPPSTASALAGQVALAGLQEMLRQDSARDGATKLVLKTRAGLTLESVILRIQSGRSSVCVSSQVGCAAHCQFCATGHMGIARSLAAEEIVEQVAVAGRILRAQGRRLRNVVFMGMGEPMHNRAAVEEAVARLIDPHWFALSPRHVMVSTIGIVDELQRFVARFPTVNLALSLHAARQEVRERLMPLAKQTPLRAMHLALREIQALRARPLMIEYLLLDGINDTDADLVALIDYCRELRVHVNLIPYNAIDDAPWLRPSTPMRHAAFSATLKAAGFAVTTRFSLGNDIAAACGQLVRPHATH
jgi:23S rRNA (adenine2503-C2)-methyltransferase